MTTPERLRRDEIWLASRDPSTGAELRGGRFRLESGSRVIESLEGLNPPIIAIGEQGRDTQPAASTVTISDVSDGLGLRFMRQDASERRFYFATSDTRYRRQVTNPRKKTDRGVPSGISAATKSPGRGGVWSESVWVSWGDEVRQYSEGAGWTDGTDPADRLLTNSAIPTNDPVDYSTGWFWPLGTDGIDYYNGATWHNIATSCVGAVVLGDSLLVVSPTGVVKRVILATAEAKIAAGTLADADFLDLVSISDTCSGFVLYTTSATGSDIVPYVIGERQFYEIDIEEESAIRAGPAKLPPNVWPMVATPLPSSNSLYIAQGMGVLEWQNNLVRPIGLDSDDGVPAEYLGGIVAMVPGFENLIALIGGRLASGTASDEMLYGGGSIFDAGILDTSAATQMWLASYEGDGWHTRATSATPTGGTNICLFISDAEDTYRVWFAFGETLYSIELEINVFNPLDDPDAEFETDSRFLSAYYDYNYLIEKKLGLLIQVETDNCSDDTTVTPFVSIDEGSYIALFTEAGISTIVDDGVHSYLLHADLFGPDYEDVPAVGKQFSRLGIAYDLVGTEGSSPAVKAVVIHAVKLQQPIRGWQVNLDLRETLSGVSGWEQRSLLLNLLSDAARGLLHFSYIPDQTDASDVVTYAVRPTTGTLGSLAGAAHGLGTSVRLSLLEGVRLE